MNQVDFKKRTKPNDKRLGCISDKFPGQTGAFVDHFKLISQVVRRRAAALTASLPYPLQVSRAAESSAPRPSFISTVANRLCSTLGAEYVDRFICCQRVRES